MFVPMGCVSGFGCKLCLGVWFTNWVLDFVTYMFSRGYGCKQFWDVLQRMCLIFSTKGVCICINVFFMFLNKIGVWFLLKG